MIIETCIFFTPIKTIPIIYSYTCLHFRTISVTFPEVHPSLQEILIHISITIKTLLQLDQIYSTVMWLQWLSHSNGSLGACIRVPVNNLTWRVQSASPMLHSWTDNLYYYWFVVYLEQTVPFRQNVQMWLTCDWTQWSGEMSSIDGATGAQTCTPASGNVA